MERATLTDSVEDLIGPVPEKKPSGGKRHRYKRKIRLSKTEAAAKKAETARKISEWQRTNPNASWRRPEFAAKRDAARNSGYKRDRTGVPDGYTRDGIIRSRRVHRTYATRIVDKIIAMADEETKKQFTGTDGEAAREAMIELVAIVRNKAETTSERRQAAKTVLEFTKQKPAAKVDATIRTAEAFLDEIADDNDRAGADAGADERKGPETPSGA